MKITQQTVIIILLLLVLAGLISSGFIANKIRNEKRLSDVWFWWMEWMFYYLWRGTQTRTRTITTPPDNGGLTCSTLSQTQTCNTDICNTDCNVTGFSRPCGTGNKTRSRSVITPSSGTGLVYPPLSE